MLFEKAPPDVQALLPVPIKNLGLKLEGSPIQSYVEQLFKELDAKGLKHFRPAFYLTSEWGCPSEEPVIGVPFYLADRRLGAIESAVNDIENEREIMMYMRHESGHAFNYAYELYNTDEWRELFGPFRRPYRDNYSFVPFSKNYVRHIAGWYAQKHPDEDFAETFAVWLTPRSNWREKYKNWPAMKKLRYVDRIAHEVGDKPPVRSLGETDFTVEDMEETIEDFYKSNTRDESQEICDLPLDVDLDDIFLQPIRSPKIAGAKRRRWSTITAKTSSTKSATGPVLGGRWSRRSWRPSRSRSMRSGSSSTSSARTNRSSSCRSTSPRWS